uniref:Uncharacterized protein n=1 Tax=Romanomermis culicivorax TaxID=13658 RepID=A0A915K685_ROMCU
TKIAGKDDAGTKIVGEEAADATKIVKEEGADASIIPREFGDAIEDQKALNHPDYDSTLDTSLLDAETKHICESHVPGLDIPWFFDEQLVKGKILTNKQKGEMADLLWTRFSPEAKIFYKDIAKACNHSRREMN